MSRADLAQQKSCAALNVPTVLALVSPTSGTLRERLLMSLALCCARQGGRVLVIERTPSEVGSVERGELQEAPYEFGHLPGELQRGAHGVLYARLGNMAPADMYVALEHVSGAPARFDLVLLNVLGDEAEELFMASLAQRVVLAVTAEEALLPRVSEQLERLATGHQQRHFTLAVGGQLSQARSYYRQLLCDPALSQVECELLENLPSAVWQTEESLQDFVQTPEAGALLNSFRSEIALLAPKGGLQLFWRSVMFCSDCSVKLCHTLMSSGEVLEVCPVQKI